MWEKEEERKERYEEVQRMWGDNPDNKEEKDIRITSTNINGFSSEEEVSEYMIGSKQFESDINCFQEIGLDTNNAEVVQGMKRAISIVEVTRGGTFQTSTPNDVIGPTRRKGRKRRGGTMIYAEKKWTGANIKRGKDELGRWSRITMEGKGDCKLSIYSVYRVNENSLESAGGETVWMQEYKQLLQRGERNPNPRQQVLLDLESEVQQLREDNNHHILICMDANESTRKKGKSKIQEFIDRLGMTDCHQHIHPELTETPTYVEGSSQIDYCIATPGIIPCIKQCGITALNYVVQGADHRSLWIDIDSRMLLGGEYKAPVGAPTRGLRLKNIKALKQYKLNIVEYCKQHRMREKIQVILKVLLTTEDIDDSILKEATKQQWVKELDKWDKLMADLMLASEKKCSKQALTKTYLWSKPLMLAGQRITYWKSRKKLHNQGISLDHLQGYSKHLHNKFGYSAMELDISTIKGELKEAWRNLRIIQKEDRANRKEYLEELAQERAKQQNITAESAIKQIQNAEESQEVHTKLNFHMKQSSKGAIDHLLIPDGEDKHGPFGKRWKKVTNTEEVEKLLLHRNEKKLKESRTSPFAIPSKTTLSKDLGHLGDTKTIQQILENEYIIGEDILQRHDSKELTLFIDKLSRYPQEVKTISPIISAEDLKGIFNNTKESTSSSPSGVHMGLWKATVAIEHIADMLAASTSLPFIYGFTKERWKRSLHVMLAKLERPYIHKLRIVQLFEADFNASLKFFTHDG